MAKEQPIANLSQQLEKIKQAFNEYKSVSESLNSSVGNTAGTGMSKVSKSVWKTMTDYFNKFPELFFGKAIKSRMLSLPPKIAHKRSNPKAMPPCGGAPYSNAPSRKPNL